MKRLFLTMLRGILLFVNLAEATQNSTANLSSAQKNHLFQIKFQ